MGQRRVHGAHLWLTYGTSGNMEGEMNPHAIAALPPQAPITNTAFWRDKVKEIETNTDFKTQQLPLARIKKIMKSDEDVRMISAEAPVVFAQACELFIMELTSRAWAITEENKRRTLQKSDVAQAIQQGDFYDFLVDIIPPDSSRIPGRQRSNAASTQTAAGPAAAATATATATAANGATAVDGTAAAAAATDGSPATDGTTAATAAAATSTPATSATTSSAAAAT